MQRREFMRFLGHAAACSVSWPLTASAQTTSTYRLGTLGPRDPFDEKSPFGSILVRVLGQQGYTLGKNMALDARGAKGDMRAACLNCFQRNEGGQGCDAFVVTGFPVALTAKAVGIATVVAVRPRAIRWQPAWWPVWRVLEGTSPAYRTTRDDVEHQASWVLLKQGRAEHPQGRDAVEQGRPRHDAALSGVGPSRQMRRRPGSCRSALREPDDFDDAFAAMDGETPDAILMVSDSLTFLIASACSMTSPPTGCRRSMSTIFSFATAA